MKKENKLLTTTHEGKISLGDNELNCAILEDGTRIISRNAIFKAFGRTKRGRAKNEVRVLNMPSFIDANNLQPFIGKDLHGVLKPYDFIGLNGKTDNGYNALILPKLCKVYLDAREKNVLKKQQLPLARASEILLLGLSNIGIIALVDEATGYQYDREKDELQQILKAYISEELLPWQKKFPDIFYKELFRLNGWDFTVRGIKKRPGVIGKWTKTLIYNELPKGVLKELEKNTPKNEKGHKSAQMHRLLTDDIGNPHLKAQINQMVTLFQLSDDMKHMWQQFEKLKLRQSGQLELPFSFDDKGHTIEPPIPIDETKLSNFNKKLKKGLDYNPKGKK
jgi:P63C domain